MIFAGNLPYNATAQTIQAHFSAVNPTSIRHRTHKEDPSRSKGFAFLEFDGYERMATCLQKFHHSRFDDGSGKPRRINVELTWVFHLCSAPVVLICTPPLGSECSDETDHSSIAKMQRRGWRQEIRNPEREGQGQERQAERRTQTTSSEGSCRGTVRGGRPDSAGRGRS